MEQPNIEEVKMEQQIKQETKEPEKLLSPKAGSVNKPKRARQLWRREKLNT